MNLQGRPAGWDGQAGADAAGLSQNFSQEASALLIRPSADWMRPQFCS